MRAQSTGYIVYLYYVPTWRHDVRTTRSVVILGASGCIGTISIALGLRSLCVRCTRRMLLPQLCGPVSAIAVCIPGKSHAFFLSLPHFIPLFLLPVPSHSTPSINISASVTFLVRRRINDLRNCYACELINLCHSGTRGCLYDATKNKSDLTRRNRNVDTLHKCIIYILTREGNFCIFS